MPRGSATRVRPLAPVRTTATTRPDPNCRTRTVALTGCGLHQIRPGGSTTQPESIVSITRPPPSGGGAGAAGVVEVADTLDEPLPICTGVNDVATGTACAEVGDSDCCCTAARLCELEPQPLATTATASRAASDSRRAVRAGGSGSRIADAIRS